jgi:stage II sporulation protein M
VFERNKTVIEAIVTIFFTTMIISAVVTYGLVLASPELVKDIQQVIGLARSQTAIPPAYSTSLYQFIFRNNVGHFWNPIRIWVWIPFVGAFSLGYELLLNAIVIGAVASFASVTRGVAYSISGLAPHGVIELPAFILEFAGLTRWHVTMTRAIYSKLSGRKVDQPLLSEGVKDTMVLSLLSVVLFAVAAVVESYVTPRLLGM